MAATAMGDGGPADVGHIVADQPFARPISALDGLRGLAIALVGWSHLTGYTAFVRGPNYPASTLAWLPLSTAAPWPWLAPVAQYAGEIGLLLFFVLSGFLLFLPYARALFPGADASWPRAGTFYVRRARRILPVYALVLACILGATVAVAAVHHTSSGVTWGDVLAGALLLFNHHRDTFNLIAAENPIIGNWDGPLWSLAVEWQFYLVLPLLALLLRRVGKQHPRRVTVALLTFIALGLAVRCLAAGVHYTGDIADPADAPGLLGGICSLVYGVRGTYLEVFALGMLGSLAYVWGIEQGGWTVDLRRRLGLSLLVVSACSAICAGAWAMASGRFQDLSGFYWPDAARHGWAAVSYVVAGDFALGLGALALLLAVFCLRGTLGRLFEVRPLTLLGLISYSIYLWHWPLMRGLLGFQQHERSLSVAGVERAAVVLVVILVWSMLSFWLVERPFLTRRSSTSRTLPLCHP